MSPAHARAFSRTQSPRRRLARCPGPTPQTAAHESKVRAGLANAGGREVQSGTVSARGRRLCNPVGGIDGRILGGDGGGAGFRTDEDLPPAARGRFPLPLSKGGTPKARFGSLRLPAAAARAEALAAATEPTGPSLEASLALTVSSSTAACQNERMTSCVQKVRNVGRQATQDSAEAATRAAQRPRRPSGRPSGRASWRASGRAPWGVVEAAAGQLLGHFLRGEVVSLLRSRAELLFPRPKFLRGTHDEFFVHARGRGAAPVQQAGCGGGRLWFVVWAFPEGNKRAQRQIVSHQVRRG